MNSPTTTISGSRFYALDAIRGIAAIAVMFYHYTQHNGLDWLHGAWVAVDIFFILSGFVLMHSYGKKFSQGMTFREFLYSRIARLGPMYLTGLALGISAAVFAMLSIPDSVLQPATVVNASVLNFFVLPYFNTYSWPFGADNIHGTVFPLNDPAWSLFFEMFVNIVFFFCLARFTKINLYLLVAISGAIFIATTIYFHQVNPGATGKSFIFGFPRVIFEFFLGVIIYKLYGYYKTPPKIFAYVIFALVSICFFSSLGAVGLGNALILAPLLIALFAKVVMPASTTNICKFLGDISYPLYVTHFPLYRLLYESGLMNNLTPALQTFAFAAIALVVAVVLVKIDETVRSSFKKKRMASLQSA